MNIKILIHLIFFFGCVSLAGQSANQNIEAISESIVNQLLDAGKKSISIVDFNHPNNDVTELGRSISNKLRINIAKKSREIKIVNRAVLASALAEEQLFKDGIIDPESAKKIKFKGVDVLIMGEIIDYGNNFSIEIQLIDTETSDMAGGEILELVKSENLTALSNKVIYNINNKSTSNKDTSMRTTPSSASSPSPKVVTPIEKAPGKEVGGFFFEHPIVKRNGKNVTVTLKTTSIGDDRNLSLSGHQKYIFAYHDFNGGRAYTDKVGIANSWKNTGSYSVIVVTHQLIQDIPCDVVISFADFPEQATMISKIDINFKSGQSLSYRSLPIE